MRNFLPIPMQSGLFCFLKDALQIEYLDTNTQLLNNCSLLFMTEFFLLGKQKIIIFKRLT